MAMQDSIRFSLVGVTTEQFAKIFEPEVEENIELNISITVNSNYLNGAIAVTPKVSFGESEKPFLILESTCHFKVEPSDWERISDSGNVDVIIPKYVIMNMVSIALGTCRGILHTKTENTEYNKYYLPLIDPETFNGEDLVIERVESNV